MRFSTMQIIQLLDLEPEQFWRFVLALSTEYKDDVSTIKEARELVNSSIQEVIEEGLYSSLKTIFSDMDAKLSLSIDFEFYSRFEILPQHSSIMGVLLTDK